MVEGHGDLHARNICMLDPPVIYDCIEFRLDFRAGEGWSYNQTNYLLLLMLVEEFGERPFETFVHERLFEPLGLELTVFGDSEDVVPGRLEHAPRTCRELPVSDLHRRRVRGGRVGRGPPQDLRGPPASGPVPHPTQSVQ